MVSCQKGPTHHAYPWQIGPFWQDTLDMIGTVKNVPHISDCAVMTSALQRYTVNASNLHFGFTITDQWVGCSKWVEIPATQFSCGPAMRWVTFVKYIPVPAADMPYYESFEWHELLSSFMHLFMRNNSSWFTVCRTVCMKYKMSNNRNPQQSEANFLQRHDSLWLLVVDMNNESTGHTCGPQSFQFPPI